ncbi:1,5-anhydro-D-fructose reductase [Oceanobacillus picturae]|uniref:1,5-anhydro-D-fructose reductase n=1 Tax=Oceanobacillus picturae TaxID=171693 RepID=A0A0U9HA01_9BACI|nr:Gfo/Idh/MocA family oxidoreductase [Oceanobacillus picturae]GAQ16984.1 1,5-anhydro-D-fructose reductase [Oceanobacillus picturae]
MKMKAGIIGCGSIAKLRHAPEYKANKQISEIVFYDRNPERSERLASMFNGSVARSINDLIEDPTIKVISDCSSNENHHIFSTKALLSGKHVLCEKPISLTVKDAQEILEAEKKSGKVLMVDHNQRFTRAHQKAREIIRGGELGKVLTFRTTFGHKGPEHWGVNKSNSTWFFKKERSGFGVAGDLGIHKLDLIHYLLEDEITKISAFQGALNKVDEQGKPIEVCDNIVASMQTKNGCLGSASFSWSYYGEEDNSTVLYCEAGILKIYPHPEYQLEVIKSTGEKINYQLETIQTNDNQTNTGVIDAFIRCVTTGEKPIASGRDALGSLKVVLGMLQAAETGRVITVNPS